ncbi:unnamed protein product [Amoebophrya sp. A120]|nr:unnamed protein product [Amoebophrya sp. A120]|eukprot:GSA120T00016251001.1
MMEDRAGKTAGSATNKMQSFNGLGEPVGFLQVFHGASKGYPWCRGPLSGQGWAGFNTTPTPTMTLGPRCTTYDPAYAEADVRSDNDHHHVHVGACLHYHFHGNGGAFEKCAWMVPINSSPGSNVQCTPVPSGVTPNPFPGWKCRVNSDKSCTAVPEGR